MQGIPQIMMMVLMVLSVVLNFAPSDAQMIDPCKEFMIRVAIVLTLIAS